MSGSKLVKSNRTFEEHTEKMLEVRELKNEGVSDREVCRKLAISHNTLQRYKELLAKNDRDSLTPEHQNEKRCELDDQIQTVINKLSIVEHRVERDHEDYVAVVDQLLSNEDLDDQIKVKLKRTIRFPVGDVLELRKLMLNAIELRSKVWALDRDSQRPDVVQTNRKIVFQVNHKVSADADKLSSIADSIIENNYHGLQTLSKEN